MDSTKSPENKSNGKAKDADEKSGFGSNLKDFFTFLRETWQEFRKISWPNREQVIKETWSVLVLVALITTMVLVFDWGVSKVVFEPLDKWAHKLGGGVGRTNQTWGPMTPVPGAPVDNPSIPGNTLPPGAPQPQPASPTGSTPAPATPAPAQPAGTPPANPVAPPAGTDQTPMTPHTP